MTALPPGNRSRTALRFTAAAAAGRFELQRCSACFALQYPPREACHRCLETRLEWTLQSGAGRLLSATVLRHSHIPYFRERLPWRIGLVALDDGPTVVAHLHQAVPDALCSVRVTARLDRAGQGVLIAMSPTESIAMNDDVRLREMSSDPGGSRVLVTEPGSPFGQSLLRELKSAGAAEVLSAQLGGGQAAAAGQAPASLDIVINNPAAGGTDASAREQMDVHYFGLIRRWEELGPALLAPRGEWPGTRAWVNILSLDALCNMPSQSTYSAAMAAAHSFSQGMRARSRSAGLRIVNVFAGPMTAENLARAVVRALIEGLEDVYPGEVAQEFLARWLQSPKALEREVGSHV